MLKCLLTLNFHTMVSRTRISAAALYVCCVCLITSAQDTENVGKECTLGWFGPNCEYPCRCRARRCSVDGACAEIRDTCQVNFFGALCQYETVLYTDASDVLLDDDDETCITEPQDKSAKVQFDTPTSFLWMRIVFRDEELMTSIKVIFQLVSSEFVACERVYLTQVNDNTVDVSCVTNTLPVIEVRFIWASNNIPCSLYISKGRGLSYKAATRSAATNAMVPQAVDDDIKTCWRSTLELTSTDTLSMVLPAVFEVNGVCFTSRNLKYWHYFFDADGNKYAPFFDRDPDRDDFCLAQKQPTIVTNFSTKIQRKGMDSTEVSLCELVVNGDCAPPAYGLACEYICSRNCLERRCYLTGECMACASGTLGKFCERVGEEEFESLELVNFIPPQQKHGPVPKPHGQSALLSSESIILLVMGVATFISIVISVCVYNKFNTGEYEEITAEEYFRRKWEEN